VLQDVAVGILWLCCYTLESCKVCAAFNDLHKPLDEDNIKVCLYLGAACPGDGQLLWRCSCQLARYVSCWLLLAYLHKPLDEDNIKVCWVTAG
jgi:hypothetical protein